MSVQPGLLFSSTDPTLSQSQCDSQLLEVSSHLSFGKARTLDARNLVSNFLLTFLPCVCRQSAVV